MRYLAIAGLTFAVCLSTAVVAQTDGPEWVEDNDAGSLPIDAQVTIGVGEMQGIQGMLEGGAFPGVTDFEDMYLIRIIDPQNFSIRTDIDGDGNADFDTQLWLFQADGGKGPNAFGLLGNDDIPGNGSGRSWLFSQSNDGSGAEVTEPGLYYLAITRFDNDPWSKGGPIFNQATRTEISGPDGNGGAFPIIGWSGDKNALPGTYRVALTGIGFAVPAPSGMLVLVLTAFGIKRRRRA